MPLIEVIQSLYASVTIRLDAAAATLIDQYATFVHGTADDVVDKALNYVFAKDREFQEYLKSSRSAKAAPSLRVRSGAGSDAAKPSANCRESTAWVDMRDGVRRESVPKA
jgi:hypothetical protein